MGAQSERNMFIVGDIDDDIQRDLILPLTIAVKKESERKDGEITMYINSYGGWAHEAFHIVELMEIAKRNDVVVRTIVMDQSLSAGSIISVAGTPGERYGAPGARWLIHYGQTGTWSETPLQNKRDTERVQNHFNRIADHYEYYCNIPDLEDHISDDNWYLDFNKAKKFGLIDKRIDKLEL